VVVVVQPRRLRTRTLSLHDALPISLPVYARLAAAGLGGVASVIPTDERCVPHGHPACNLSALRAALAADRNLVATPLTRDDGDRSEEHTSELQSRENLVCRPLLAKK